MKNNIPTATVPDLKSKTPYEIYEPLKIPNLTMPTRAEVKRAKNKMQLFALFFRAWCAYKHKYKDKLVLHHSFYRIGSDGKIDPFDTVIGTRTVEIEPKEMPDLFDTWPKFKIHGEKKQ